MSENDEVQLLDAAGQPIWTRDEALAHVVDAVFLQLPTVLLPSSSEKNVDRQSFASVMPLEVLQYLWESGEDWIKNFGGERKSVGKDDGLMVSDQFGFRQLLVATTR